MKIGVIADVHGNLEALDAVLSALKAEGMDRVVCLGDLVGYGPDPEACIEGIRTVSDLVVAGNHDWAAGGRISTVRFNPAARQTIEWTESKLSRESKDYLTGLPMGLETEGFTCVHASPDGSIDWPYLVSSNEAWTHSGPLENSVVLFGHTHIPTVFTKDGRRFRRQEGLGGTDFEIAMKSQTAMLINPGSVGQPRDGKPDAAFGLIDTDRGVFRFMRAAYPVQDVQEKMRRAGLPGSLIERLAYGF
jgi:predicted phosphodiesterase